MTSAIWRAINKAHHNVWLWNPHGCGEMDMPIIRAVDVKPPELVGFNHFSSNRGGPSRWLHCFLHDCQIQRLWDNPRAYIPGLKRRCWGGILSPAFSHYGDAPLPLRIFNTYRNRWVGAYMQRHGIPVVPSIYWGSPESYDYCFLGVEPGGTVAITTLGFSRLIDRRYFFKGYDAMMERLRPSRVLVFGRRIKGLDGVYYPPFYDPPFFENQQRQKRDEPENFASASEFIYCFRHGCELSFCYRGKSYSLGRYYVYDVDNGIDTTYRSAKAMLDHPIGRKRLRDILQDMVVKDRTVTVY